jgi:O-antigen ligase
MSLSSGHTMAPAVSNAGAMAIFAAAVLAPLGPALLIYELRPSPVAFTYTLAVALWGALVLLLKPAGGAGAVRTLLAAIAVVAVHVGLSWGWRGLPGALAMPALGLLAGAAILAWAGARAAASDDAVGVWRAFAWGWVIAGIASAVIAAIQVFVPAWADGDWIAKPPLPGRATGNLRQPNQMGGLVLWSLIALAALLACGRLRRAAAWAIAVLLVFAIELSGSRMAAGGLLVLAAWGLFDRRLPRAARVLLVALPGVYALEFGAMQWVAAQSGHALGAGARLAAEGLAAGSANSRLNIWRNALQMIAQQPWLGVGFGNFNFAWTLTPFAGRPTAFFDHTHSLPLQLAVELGVPMALLVLLLFGHALVTAWRRSRSHAGERGTSAMAAWMMVATILLYSLVEYPLWMPHFLLPAAFAWGFASVAAGGTSPVNAGRAGRLLGLLLCVGGIAAALDYLRVAAVFRPAPDIQTVVARLAAGQRSVFFGTKGDYMAATTTAAEAQKRLAFERAPHDLLDVRLMMAWANALAQQGRVDEARYLADRLREFRHPDAAPWFAACATAAEPKPFQCTPPSQPHTWRDFLPR